MYENRQRYSSPVYGICPKKGKKENIDMKEAIPDDLFGQSYDIYKRKEI